MSEKLPVSRLQRDLTDSTVLRNIGTIFGHMLIAYKNLNIGLQKLDINHIVLKQDLHNNTVVIVEGLQTILRKHGHQNAYELFKDIENNIESNFFTNRVNKIKMVNIRSKLNQFIFHLSSPLTIFFRNIFLKRLVKNKKFLESYLGKIYRN